MRVEPELPDHPKFLRLKRRIGDVAMECLVRMWGHCQQNQRGGHWPSADAEYLEIVCKWSGKAGELHAALVDTKWIEEAGGGLLIHDWEEVNCLTISGWRNGKKGGRPRRQNGQNPETDGFGKGNRLQTDGFGKGNRIETDCKPTGSEKVTESKPTANRIETDCKPSPHSYPILSYPVEGVEGEIPPKLPYAQAQEALEFLNSESGATFLPTHATLYEAALRLHEVNRDLDGVKKMIARQVALWSRSPKMRHFLRPATLFDSRKFHDYYGQREMPVESRGELDGPDRRKQLQEAIDKSPANRESVYHRADCGEQEKEQLKKWRADLARLSA